MTKQALNYVVLTDSDKPLSGCTPRGTAANPILVTWLDNRCLCSVSLHLQLSPRKLCPLSSSFILFNPPLTIPNFSPSDQRLFYFAIDYLICAALFTGDSLT